MKLKGHAYKIDVSAVRHPAWNCGECCATENHTRTTTIQLILAWGLVGIPLAWGVLPTIESAMKLFR